MILNVQWHVFGLEQKTLLSYMASTEFSMYRAENLLFILMFSTLTIILSISISNTHTRVICVFFSSFAFKYRVSLNAVNHFFINQNEMNIDLCASSLCSSVLEIDRLFIAPNAVVFDEPNMMGFRITRSPDRIK